MKIKSKTSRSTFETASIFKSLLYPDYTMKLARQALVKHTSNNIKYTSR